MRSFVRVIAVVLLALYGFASTLPDIAILWRPFGTFGLTTDALGRVRSVAPQTPAAQAGIEPGDRVQGLSVAPVTEVWVARPGVTRTVTVTHNGVKRQATLVAHATKLPSGGSVLYPLRKIFAAFFIIAGLLLLLVRPSPATWGFFLYCVGSNPFEGWYLLGAALPPKVYLACSIVDDVMNAAGIVGLLTFALYFPRSSVSGWRAQAQRYLVLLFVFTAALNLSVDLSSRFARPPQWIIYCPEIWFDTLFVAAAGVFLATYASSRGEDRERVAWTTFGMTVGMVGLVAADIYGLFTWSVFSTAGWFERLSSMLIGVVPITIIYAAVRHRVLDFSLAVNRTLVYGVTTSVVIALFAMLHSLVVRIVHNTELGTLTELLAAIAIGFSLQALHQRVSAFVDRVFFRGRYRARQRIDQAAEALEYARLAKAVDEALAAEPCRALDLKSSAVFRAESEISSIRPRVFTRRATYGWESAALSSLNADDVLVLHVKAQQQPLRIADTRWTRAGLPEGAAAPQFAVPVLSGRRLVGIALYGGHTSGSELDADEVAMINRLARAAAAAYDRLEVDELRQYIRDHVATAGVG